MSREITIQLTKGGTALISEEDLHLVKDRKWCLSKQGYPVSVRYLGRVNGKTQNEVLLLHRLIAGPMPGQVVDHINRIKTDCRRCNLRLVDHAQNAWNTKLRTDNTSGVKGLGFNQALQKWHARLVTHGVETHIGYFIDKDLAIQAIKNETEKRRGGFNVS